MSCTRFSEDVVGLLEGNAGEALRQHVASCDDCRDRAHLLEQVTARASRAGDDFVPAAPLADRLAEIVAEAHVPERVSITRMKVEAAPPPKRSVPASKRSIWLLVAALASVGASAFVGVKIADHQRSPSVAATRAWHGKVTKIQKSGADQQNLAGLTVNKQPLGEGSEIKEGMHLSTDGKTRARIAFDDGSWLVLDRATEVTIDGAPRTVTLSDGSVLADVAHVDGAPWAKVKTPNGEVKVLGTQLQITAASDRTNVEVLRGEVEISTSSDTHKVSAGQEGVIGKDGKVDVAPANDLAQRAAFGEQLIATHNEDADAPASGLGELRAKRPGRTDEKDHAVHLSKHGVKIRIAGNVARTEIDETFSNDTDDELEGIYRFPLPPGAQIERLALEVDGKLVDGEFVDKSKASAIWRGAIQNAAPKAPKPREEIVWVPGPWHDPALLEWQRGGRFELRIFPIPKKGARRVVIAYTETVAPSAGVRRYVYPLPQGSSSNLTIDQFTLDAQVLGHDPKTPVRARGYELEKKSENGADRLSTSMTAFSPSGDLAIEYALDDKGTDATAWAYKPEPRPAEKNDPIGNDAFVSIALRPKLPKWSESKPRDHVIVLDSGRAMYGERFARARRLAVQLTQEMDRRDRVTVLACDVSCKAMPAGFLAPGAPSAHDVDAFLTGVTTDGASDLVGAVRTAGKVPGHDSGRDLRVILLSDGVATAGYRATARVPSEIGDALADKSSLLVTVPIGADADTAYLADMARGGGGVVVPYQPGERLEASALDVLNAAYGTTLRDVEVVLPDGLRDTAPAIVAPIRAGGETIINARMSGDFAKGDVILRGKVGGDPFEAKYPIEVHATTDAGNAFVPRLFAASRIADLEHQDRGARTAEQAKTELVQLSRRFSVPAKGTSLLVLESEAMFKAFGIERADHAPSWTGESIATGTTVATIAKESPSDESVDLSQGLGLVSPSESVAAAKGDDAEPKDKAFTRGAAAAAAPRPASPAPAATMTPEQQAEGRRHEAPAKKAPKMEALGGATADSRFFERERRRGGQFMKKVFVRHATLSTDASPPVSADKVAQARAAVAAAPDERSKHKDLARMLALSGQIDELGETLDKWSTRDPLDVDVIAGRADVVALRGDREGALRIMSGALAASALGPSDAFGIAQSIARSFDRLGKPEACAFWVAAAELKAGETDATSRAMVCERQQGRAASADRWMASLSDKQRAALAKVDPPKPETAVGDVVVSATWSGGVDLDIALIDPKGRRTGAVTRLTNTRVEGAASRDHETLAFSSSDAGSYLVEIVRANASENTLPVSGTVNIKAFGETRSIPFTLTGPRVQVGKVDVRWEAELVPLDNDPLGPGPVQTFNNNGLPPFDRGAAATALAMVPVNQCGASGQVGTGHVTVTFSAAGSVASATVDDANFSGTPAGRCVQAAFFGAHVPAFSGAPVRIGKSFTVGAPMAR